jgi:hypothetical protein
MGLFGGSTTTTTNEKFDSGPSSFQRPHLDRSFNAAGDIYNKQANSPFYQGDFYAGMSPDARSALDSMRGFASGTGLSAANTISGIGQNLAGNSNRAGGLVDDYLSASNPEALTASANKFANDPFLQQRIDAAAGDVRRNLTENTLPSIDRNASAGGNINSSRAGIASGIAQRGAQTDIMNIGANMRSQAFDRGLGLAQGAADSRLNASRAFSDLGSQGINALGRGAEVGYGAFNQINQAGAMDQADRQGQLDGDFRKWQGNDTREWDMLGRYHDIIGSNQWGQSGTSSGTTKVKEQGSILNQLISAGTAAASFFPSDRRLKEIHRQLGTLEDGLPIYSWSYLWEPGVIRIGPMAQDVAEFRPEALGPEVGGYMTIIPEKL